MYKTLCDTFLSPTSALSREVSSKAAGAGGSPVNVDLEVFLYYKLKVARLPQLVRGSPPWNFIIFRPRVRRRATAET